MKRVCVIRGVSELFFGRVISFNLFCFSLAIGSLWFIQFLVWSSLCGGCEVKCITSSHYNLC